MKKTFFGILILFILSFSLQTYAAQNGLKVFISVDMEGVSGVIHWEDVGREGTPNAVLKHTMNGQIDVFINGTNMPEAGINGAAAGYYGVPVVMVAGDAAIVKQARDIFGNIEAVAVKESIGTAAKMLHPKKAQQLIRQKTEEALSNLSRYKPLKLQSPITMNIVYKEEIEAYRASRFPEAKKTGERSVSYTHEDFLEILKFFMFVR